MLIRQRVSARLLVMDTDFDLTKLPPPDTGRWVVRRKAAIVQAVRNGSISLQEACRRYTLSIEEFLAWERAVDRYGVPGLRVTRLQIYRDTDEARAGNRSVRRPARRGLHPRGTQPFVVLMPPRGNFLPTPAS